MHWSVVVFFLALSAAVLSTVGCSSRDELDGVGQCPAGFETEMEDVVTKASLAVATKSDASAQCSQFELKYGADFTCDSNGDIFRVSEVLARCSR